MRRVIGLRPGDKLREGYHYDADPETGCWIWKWHLEQGYGRFKLPINGKRVSIGAYRFAYESVHGSIQKGLTIDHLCRNRSCVNPDHMEPVTSTENVMRGKGVGVVNKYKTSCPKGHPYTIGNIYMGTKGNGNKFRMCRTCNLDYQRKRRARQ